MSSLNYQQLNWAQNWGYDVDEEGTVRHAGHHIPIPSLPTNLSQYAHISLNSLASHRKPIPVLDYGEQSEVCVNSAAWKQAYFVIKDVFQGIHKCLHRAPYQTIESIAPFVVLTETGYASIFPGCRHVAFYRNYMDVIVHIFQEHLEDIDLDYFCILCNRQYSQKQDAKRHAITATQGAIHACDISGCSYKTTRKDSLRSHKERMHQT